MANKWLYDAILNQCALFLVHSRFVEVINNYTVVVVIDRFGV